MPWKRCPNCQRLSYSAATTPIRWICPHCEHDLTLIPDIVPDRAEIEAEFMELEGWREYLRRHKRTARDTRSTGASGPDRPLDHGR